MANIFETARAEHQYNKFVSGIESFAGLVDTLSGPGPFTIFVPSNAAFDRLSSDQQANLFADSVKLARVIMYHIVPGYYNADDLLDRLFLKTLGGQRLRVWSDISMVPLGPAQHQFSLLLLAVQGVEHTLRCTEKAIFCALPYGAGSQRL